MAGRLQKIRQERIERLKKLWQLGIDPYPSQTKRREVIMKAREKLGKVVSVAGRIMAIRDHGGIQFFDLRDGSGKIQLVFRNDQYASQTSNVKLLTLLDIGDFLSAQGKVFIFSGFSQSPSSSSQ